MRAWLLIGSAGWLCGAVIATAGSMYAIDQLGRGLLDQPANRVSIALVNSELAGARPAHPIPATTHAPNRSSATSVRAAAMFPASRPRQRPPADPTRAIDTADGTAGALCEQGRAYLVYEIPWPGFSIRDLRPGPAQAATITFRNSSGGLVLRVTCTGRGVPLTHVSTVRPGGG